MANITEDTLTKVSTDGMSYIQAHRKPSLDISDDGILQRRLISFNPSTSRFNRTAHRSPRTTPQRLQRSYSMETR